MSQTTRTTAVNNAITRNLSVGSDSIVEGVPRRTTIKGDIQNRAGISVIKHICYDKCIQNLFPIDTQEKVINRDTDVYFNQDKAREYYELAQKVFDKVGNDIDDFISLNAIILNKLLKSLEQEENIDSYEFIHLCLPTTIQGLRSTCNCEDSKLKTFIKI